jgi:hypothetical protein
LFNKKKHFIKDDPFGSAEALLFRMGKKALLRVNFE